MGDIDLLVRPELVPSALAVMSNLYGPASTGDKNVDVSVDHEHQVMFQRSDKSPIVFDLHWTLLDSPYHPHSLITDWLWESATPVQIGGAPALTLGREALLLHLSGHLLIDKREKSLLWLYDIAFALTLYRDQIDWDLLFAQAQLYGLMLPVHYALTKACEEWHVLIPNGVQGRLECMHVSPSEKEFYDWSESKDRAAVRLFRANLASIAGWAERFRYIWSSLFPPIQFMERRYQVSNRLLVPFSYLYRWLFSLYKVFSH
jgi:hypothetical protein